MPPLPPMPGGAPPPGVLPPVPPDVKPQTFDYGHGNPPGAVQTFEHNHRGSGRPPPQTFDHGHGTSGGEGFGGQPQTQSFDYHHGGDQYHYQVRNDKNRVEYKTLFALQKSVLI